MSKAKILFVDDEERIVRSLRVLFQSEDRYRIYLANSGEEALKLAASTGFHVVVSDQRMPGMSGVELLKRIRKISPHTIGILLTGFSELDDIVASINEGEIFRYITKPWKNDQLKETISNAVDIAEKISTADMVTSVVEDSDLAVDMDSDECILVLHPHNDDDVPLMVTKLFDRRKILCHSDISSALDAMVNHDIAIVVADIGRNKNDPVALLKMIKQHHPLSLAVVVADSADSHTAISLINEGQIYRYLTKPVQAGRLKLSIASALEYRKRCAHNPVVLQRHQVEEIHNPEEKAVMHKFLAKLSIIKKRMAIRFGGAGT